MKEIKTSKAPAAIGPYSQAIRAGEFLFCSGQIPIDPDTGQLVDGDVADQTRQVMTNLRMVLESAGLGLTNVAKTTIFLTDLNDFAAVNEIYGSALGTHKPARATVQVAALPLGALIEIECVAYAGE